MLHARLVLQYSRSMRLQGRKTTYVWPSGRPLAIHDELSMAFRKTVMPCLACPERALPTVMPIALAQEPTLKCDTTVYTVARLPMKKQNDC